MKTECNSQIQRAASNKGFAFLFKNGADVSAGAGWVKPFAFTDKCAEPTTDTNAKCGFQSKCDERAATFAPLMQVPPDAKPRGAVTNPKPPVPHAPPPKPEPHIHPKQKG